MTKPSPITTHIACSMLPFTIFDLNREMNLKQRIFQLKTNSNLKNSSFHYVITLPFDLIHSFISFVIPLMYPVYRCIMHVVDACIIYGFPPLFSKWQNQNNSQESVKHLKWERNCVEDNGFWYIKHYSKAKTDNVKKKAHSRSKGEKKYRNCQRIRNLLKQICYK